MTAWRVVADEVEAKPPKKRSVGSVVFILLITVLSLTACVGVVGYVFLADIQAWLGGGEVAETVTALVGSDMQVVVVKLRHPIVIERAVLVLQSGEEIESSTPTTEPVDTIAFLVALEGGNSIPSKVMVRHKAGNFSYDYKGNQ